MREPDVDRERDAAPAAPAQLTVMSKKGGGGWSVVRVPDSALVPEGAGVRAAGGLYVGVCVYEACGFVCGVGELLGWYGAECTCAARGLFFLLGFERLRVY